MPFLDFLFKIVDNYWLSGLGYHKLSLLLFVHVTSSGTVACSRSSAKSLFSLLFCSVALGLLLPQLAFSTQFLVDGNSTKVFIYLFII